MTNFKARKTTYKGIGMRSRLEAGFAMWLDKWKFDWEYEPRAFASEKGQYLPDFLLKGVQCSWRDPANLYIEVKPQGWPFNQGESITAPNQYGDLIRKLCIIQESEPDAEVALVCNRDIVYTQIIEWVDFTGVPQQQVNECHGVDLLRPEAPDSPLGLPGWPAPAIWVRCPDETLGLGLPVYEAPWPPEYWKGPPR